MRKSSVPSDDGEPSGTAWCTHANRFRKPRVDKCRELLSLGISAGIKLGAGGLIGAYAGAVANAVKNIGVVKVKEQEGISDHHVLRPYIKSLPIG